MKIVNCESKHLSALKCLSDSLFNDGWTQKQFQDELENYNAKIFLLENNNQIVGFVCLRTNTDEMEILNIGVGKDFQGKGYGKILLQKAIEYAEKKQITQIFLEVREDNTKALNLYKTMGFCENRRRKKYYASCDELELIKKI